MCNVQISLRAFPQWQQLCKSPLGQGFSFVQIDFPALQFDILNCLLFCPLNNQLPNITLACKLNEILWERIYTRSSFPPLIYQLYQLIYIVIRKTSCLYNISDSEIHVQLFNVNRCLSISPNKNPKTRDLTQGGRGNSLIWERLDLLENLKLVSNWLFRECWNPQ